MTELYNQANAIVLPSFSDPSPLSLVEGLLFHLPILCSNHCGNHFEAVENDKNGCTFWPNDPIDIKATFERFMSYRDKWKEMGEYSAMLYYERFETEKVINSFVDQYSKIRK